MEGVSSAGGVKSISSSKWSSNSCIDKKQEEFTTHQRRCFTFLIHVAVLQFHRQELVHHRVRMLTSDSYSKLDKLTLRRQKLLLGESEKRSCYPTVSDV